MSFSKEIKKTIREIACEETCLREKDLEKHNDTLLHVHTTKDLCHIEHFVGVFSKGLPHDSNGLVDPEQMKLLLKALKTGDRKYIDQITLGNPDGMKLVNLMAYASTEFFGVNIASYQIEKSPTFSSAETAGEMVELYEMYLCRDVNFNDFATNPLIADAVSSLNQLSDFRGICPVSPKNLFRGISAGDLAGPYISQFMYFPFKYGVFEAEQLYKFPQAGTDYLKTKSDYLLVQNGTIPQPQVPFDQNKRYVNTIRDLAEYVHNDMVAQLFYVANLILNTMKAPINKGNPFKSCIKNEVPFVTLGQVDIHELLHRAIRISLHAGWLQKILFLRIRPEVFAYEVNRAKCGHNFGVHVDVLSSPTLSRVFAKNGNYLLPGVYPEGSPVHPAYPSGHACLAGAGATILKAFYDGDWVFPQAYIANGNQLVTIPDKLTLSNELDKLASNCATGRNMAGIHYRSDGEEGIRFGEKIAIEMLREHVKRYDEKVHLQITKRNGKKIVICN